MKTQQNPSFRKVFSPWHESDLFCLAISLFAALVFYFSLVGVSVALESDAYQTHCWVPIALMLLSGSLLAINLFRVLRRMTSRPAEGP